MFDLTKISKEIHEYHRKTGHYDTPATMPDRCMMVVNEIVAAINSHSDEKRTLKSDLSIFLRMYDMQMNLTNPYYEEKIKGTVEDELSDALIKLLDLIGLLDIDIDNHLQAKLLYLQKQKNENENRTTSKKN